MSSLEPPLIFIELHLAVLSPAEHKWISLNFIELRRQPNTLSFIEPQWFFLSLTEPDRASLSSVEPQLNSTEPHWTQLSFSDLHWASLSLMELHWAQLSFAELHRLPDPLSLAKPQWILLSPAELHWSSLSLMELHWASLNSVEPRWASPITRYSEPHSTPMNCFVPHRISLSFIELCGAIAELHWAPRNFFAFHWDPIKELSWISLSVNELHWTLWRNPWPSLHQLNFTELQWIVLNLIRFHWDWLSFTESYWTRMELATSTMYHCLTAKNAGRRLTHSFQLGETMIFN